MSSKYNFNKIQFDRISILVILVFIGNLIAITTCLINSKMLGLGSPYNTYLYLPNDRFMDFFNPFRIAAAPYQRFDAVAAQQMPLFYVFLDSLKIFTHNVAFGLVVAIFSTFFAVVFAKLIHQKNYWKTILYTLILFSTYPVVFVIDRGNLEMIFFIILLVSILLFDAEKYALSAMVLSIGVAFKPFSIFLLPLFIYKKRYWECVLIASLVLPLTFFSLMRFPGGVSFNYQHWMHLLSLYGNDYDLGINGIIYGCSIWGAIKLMIMNMYFPLPLANFTALFRDISHIYFYGAALITIFITYFVIRYPFAFWKKLTLLICCMNMFPLTTADYRLLQFFIPLYFWLLHKSSDPVSEQSSWYDYCYLLLFALILIPRNYYHFHDTLMTSAVYTSPLIMILFTIVIFVDCYISNRDKWQASKLQLEPSAP